MNAAPGSDALERETALDPSRSFIVQAPAGSGKTGLLIQRVLRLLAVVQRPEEILAITFTRKAAAEMRRRVLQALQLAAGDVPPERANERLTWELARAALARDREKGWQLAQNAARIRIQTIDSLCTALARQMPVLSGIGAPPAIVEKAQELYREAAERTLARVETEDAIAGPVRRLLVHLDGDWSTARGLLEGMLARRDQWIRRVAGFTADGVARAALEASFRRERARIMQRLHTLMPAGEEALLATLATHAGVNVGKAVADSPIARLARLAGYPTPDEAGADDWSALAHLLLVASDAQMRKKVDKRQGFPAEDKGPFKGQMHALLERLAPMDELCEALHAVRSMPPPRFTDAQWEVLGALVSLLPQAAAELQIVFSERGEIDFPGLAQGAVRALGDEDSPTDLLLALDVKLAHLLVDEFQDTSLGQWDLLTRLTAGWMEGDGRTVFLVGDPMQSIYRFREADVALFLRARLEGLPTIPLTGVRLATNFRSQAGIVSWVNTTFAQVLSAAEDPDSGAVPYVPSSPHHPREPGVAVQWHAFVERDSAAARQAEAARVVRITAEALQAGPEETVAILVRTRSHLDRIVPALKNAGIRFRALDIEPLGGRPVVQDLLAIARALAHLADRIAWLALLRAPWCGLSVADLHALTEAPLAAEGARLTAWELLHDEARLRRMTAAGAQRARRVRDVLDPYVAGRLRASLRERVEGAWLALGGPACLERASDLEDAETFFDQLDELEEAGDLPDPTVLEEHLSDLYAAPDTGEEARVQVMTIHKAKGLEFATVIVPGLDRTPRSGDRPLFAWKARADGTLMMAPIHAAGEAGEPAYDYLRALDDAAAEHEAERLLYVAATRAEKRLHLLGYARLDEKGDSPRIVKPSERSLLGKAWVVAQREFDAALGEAQTPAEESAPAAAPREGLRQLDLAVLDVEVAELSIAAAAPPADEPVAIEFSWAGETARHIGTITHRWLQRIGEEGVARWNAKRIAALAPAIARALARRGIPPAEREGATGRVIQALEGAIGDERGRWLLNSWPDAKSEYRMRVAGPEGVKLIVIDRMFSDEEGRRWIVDYKTGGHEGGDLEAFLDRELGRYAPQLTGYRAAFESGPFSLGLYFPLVKGWREFRP
ncbi:MAG: UvrD-helicase domain-containing protein [Usitatibacter sp.]